MATRVRISQWDAANDEEALPLADDGVHHEFEDGGRDGPALGDAAPGLEGEPKTPGGFVDQDTVVSEGLDQPQGLGPHPAVLKDLETRPRSMASYALRRFKNRL